MAINLDPAKIESLDHQADLAYNELKRALETREPADAHCAKQLYSNVITSTLNIITSHAGIIYWRRDEARSKALDYYILQNNIGIPLSVVLYEAVDFEQTAGNPLRLVATDTTIEQLRKAVCDPNECYININSMTRNLAQAGHLEQVFEVLTEVRQRSA